MAKLAFAIGMVGAALCASTGSAAEPVAPPPTSSDGESAAREQESKGDRVEVAFDQDRYERMTVPVTIDGKGPYRFFIDTGAQATVVTSRIKEDLSLEPSGRAMLVAMGSRRVVETLALDRLEFADRVLSGITSPLLERKHIGADGILGLDSLQDMRVLIDFAEDRMSIADADRTRDNSGFEIVVKARAKLGQMIITDAMIDGVKVAVIIDTGAQNTVGNFALLKKLKAREKDTFVSTDVHGTTITGGLAYAEALKIGRMQLTNIPIGFADSPAMDALGYGDRPALILGMGNLRLFQRVAIDFSSRRVLFDMPGNVSGPQRWRFNERATRLES